MITKSILLPCDRTRAFELFTTRISEWWPPGRRHTSDPNSSLVLSQSGRFFERDQSGNEVELGAVLTWQAPARLVLDWYPGTDREHATRVEVLFTPEASGTRVTIQHSATLASEELFPSRATRYDASWKLVLEALQQAAGLDKQ